MLLSSKLFQKQASFLAQMTISTALLSCDMFPVVEQLPTITAQTSGSLITLPYDENFLFKCEAKGNPRPAWVRCPALKDVKKNRRNIQIKLPLMGWKKHSHLFVHHVKIQNKNKVFYGIDGSMKNLWHAWNSSLTFFSFLFFMCIPNRRLLCVLIEQVPLDERWDGFRPTQRPSAH